ncbi:MAG: NUDIX hydrolase [Deltaproteobacteria bacterium]|nr:MAG: NUDIX hydrolase [Deltaproteobacteria bacterium]
MSENDNKRTVWRGRAFDFNVEDVTLPDGRKTAIEVIRHPGSSGIVPVEGTQFVTLIRQYRPAAGRFIWEVPAGTMHPGEDPLECAKRELQEECGLIGQNFKKLGTILIAPGYSDERIHLFMATGLTPCRQNLDEDEVLTTRSVSFDQTVEMIDRGEIQDAMSIIALTMARRELKGK